MKRLTNREIKEYILANYFDGDENVDACVDGDEEITVMANIVKLLEKLAEYEGAEEAGRLIRLPCKVGDKVYTINFPFITEDEIEQVIVAYETRTEVFNEWEIGQYAHFTREEAEAALEEWKGE